MSNCQRSTFVRRLCQDNCVRTERFYFFYGTRTPAPVVI